MKTITLENGKKVAISEESYKALEDAVREVTWEDIHAELFDNSIQDYLQLRCTSSKYRAKLIAINKLTVTAKYLNGDWKPDWDVYSQRIWQIVLIKNSVEVLYSHQDRYSFVYFKSEEAAQRAISILGEETIRTAFSTDW